MSAGRVRRTFVDSPYGQIHCRVTDGLTSGGEPPLLMLHGGPGSSAGLMPMITAIAERGMGVVAPDLMGNGLSDPPPVTPDMAFYVDCLCSTLDALGLEQVDCYGHHVGAQIGCELAIRAPGRVRRLMLDGVALFSPEQRREFLERYAPTVEPHPDGGHLASLWTFLSATTVRFPHYSQNERDLIAGGMPNPAPLLTDLLAEVVRNWRTYHLSYEASFAEDFAGRLPLVRRPAVVLQVNGDPLAQFAEQAASLLLDGQVLRVDRTERAGAIAHIVGRPTS